MNYIKVVENSDNNIVYGLLIVKDLDEETVQKEIYKIKNSTEEIFQNGTYTIEDIFERLPSDWIVEFVDLDGTVEV